MRVEWSYLHDDEWGSARAGVANLEKREVVGVGPQGPVIKENLVRALSPNFSSLTFQFSQVVC